MTNLDAYSVTFKNPNGEGAIRLTLTVNGLDPDASDKNELAMAYAIHDQVTSSDFSQGGTSDTLTPLARSLLIRKASLIFAKHEIVNPFEEGSSTIEGKSW